MHLLKTCLISAALALPATTHAESFLSEENVVYRGDSTAVRICKAVINDDTVSLKQGLRRIRNQALSGYKFELESEAIAGSVQCNQKNLLTFADEIGARSVSGWLRRGTVTVEEVVATDQ